MAGKIAIFRCDAGTGLGAGHVMRCLAIARSLAEAGWRTAFAAGPGTQDAVPGFDAGAEDARTFAPEAGAEALASAWPEGADLLAVDHYGLDAGFERTCRPWAKRILAVDDLANRAHDADWLLDPTPGRDGGRYRDLVPASCEVLAGAAFAPIRAGFLRQRAESLARRATGGPVRRVLVSLGATDPTDATSVALAALSIARMDAEIDVVLGRGAPHRAAVVRALPKTARLSVDVADMAERIAAADIAIGACGISALERCCLGLPTVTVVVADNQRDAAAGLARAGAALVLRNGVPAPDALADALKRLSDEGTRAAMAAAAARLCDGRGSQRLRAALAGAVDIGGAKVSLTIAEGEDRARLLVWQREPGARRYSRNPSPPTEAQHDRWFAGVLCDPERTLCIVLADGKPCGMLRLDRLPRGTPAFEVSILIAEAYRGRGLGRAALALARRLAPGARLDAEVHPGNSASREAFAAAGYVRVADNLFRSEAA